MPTHILFYNDKYYTKNHPDPVIINPHAFCQLWKHGTVTNQNNEIKNERFVLYLRMSHSQ